MNLKEIVIVPFKEDYSNAFYELNAEWLEKYFYIEPYDKKVLSNPKEYIVDKGGYIFVAIFEEEIIGVVALIKQKDFFELSKMAVKPKYHGKKIGKLLVNYCIEFGYKKGWKSITLYSHRKLVPAISLYKKLGFKEIELEKDVHYERANIIQNPTTSPISQGK